MKNTIEDIRQPICQELQQFNEALREICKTDNQLLSEVLSYTFAKQGKQLRPIIVLLCAKLVREVNNKTIGTAVALELLHTASLVHDDVVDNSRLRRGQESIQAHWNNKVAVLTGDYLLSKVISIISSLRNTQILNIVAELGMSLSSGELLQLHSKGDMWISEQEYYRMIEQKTATLFAACSEAGAVSAGATEKQTKAIKAFGKYLGMCFQLKDDAFDYSDLEDIGKRTMSDIRDGKATLPLLISLQRAPEMEAQYIRDLAQNSNLSDAAEQEIKSFVLRYDGLRYTYHRMEYYKQKALEAISIFHDSRTLDALKKTLDYTISRMY